MAEMDWSTFVVRIDVNASVEKLYSSWATRLGMESWFLRMSEYKKPGGESRADDELVQNNDTYRWRWFGYPDEVTEEGSILDSNGKDFFKFSFGKAGDCSVRITTEEEVTIVELKQENIPTDEPGRQHYHLGCKTGWTFYFANLKSILEGGIDLRNKNEALKDLINS